MIDRPYLDFDTHAPGLVKVALERRPHSSFAATEAAPPPVPLRNADSLEVLRIVAAAYAIQVDDIIGRSRSKNIREARLVSYWLLRTGTEMSFPELGLLFGDRDHTTIMSGVASCERQQAASPKFRQFAEKLSAAVRARTGARAA